jgi:hypothetical protein
VYKIEPVEIVRLAMLLLHPQWYSCKSWLLTHVALLTHGLKPSLQGASISQNSPVNAISAVTWQEQVLELRSKAFEQVELPTHGFKFSLHGASISQFLPVNESPAELEQTQT